MYQAPATSSCNGAAAALPALEKVPTGLTGLDEVLSGGLPRGRPTLVCGAPGCGKTLFGMQFLVRGALDYGEAGVFIAFEERPEDLAVNVASLGFDLAELERRKLLAMDHIRVEPREIIENGEYDLEGLFLRLGMAIDEVGAKRVVIDTLEMLLGGLSNYGVVRAELRRLFEWLKERGVTAVITAERGDGKLTRHGLEEYVSDCVIVLDHRIEQQVSTRRLRVVKYRGSTHGTNEYPFLIDEGGVSVLPSSGASLQHAAWDQRVSSGVAGLDHMLGGGGYFRGSTVLVAGTPGAGKSSVAAHFANASCAQNERVLFMSFEESAPQIVRNMGAVGIDLQPWLDIGRLRFIASRPTSRGIETHLSLIHRAVREFRPSAVILDPVNHFSDGAGGSDSYKMLVRLLDSLKGEGITALMTSLSGGDMALEHAESALSQAIDTWLSLRTSELNGERNRALYVVKSRGMAHSNQVREFLITARGIELIDAYVGPGGALTGAARANQESTDKRASLLREQEIEQKRRVLERRKAQHREQLAKLQGEFESEVFELQSSLTALERADEQMLVDRVTMARRRQADALSTVDHGSGGKP